MTEKLIPQHKNFSFLTCDNNYFLLTQAISILPSGTGEVNSTNFIHSLLKPRVIKASLDAYTFKNILNLQNHSSLINHYLSNVNRKYKHTPSGSNKTTDHISIHLWLGKISSPQCGLWWPPRKQVKKKTQ